MFNRWFLPSFRPFGQVVSEKKNCLNRPIRKKNCLWRPRLLTDRDEMCKHYRGPSIDAFFQDLIQLAKRFQRRRLKTNSPIKTKICLWWLCLLTDPDRMSNLNRGPYMVCFIPRFSSFGQEVAEEKMFSKSTNQKQELPLAVMLINGLGQNG